MKKVLIPLTNHATLGATDEVNGTYSPELTHALDVLIKEGIDYDFASIKGGKAPITVPMLKTMSSTPSLFQVKIFKVV